jgi:O-antigen biosynthesis protein
MPDLSIIILTYNSAGYIIPCLESIFKIYKKEIDDATYEVILFDNASQDNTVSLTKDFFVGINKPLRKISDAELTYKNIILHENGKNSGFGKGVNEAYTLCNGRNILLLNPDAVIQDNSFKKAIEYLDTHPHTGIAGGKILNVSGEPEKSAGKFYSIANSFILAMGLEEAFKIRFSPDDIRPVDYVSGGFMFMKRDVFEMLGGFDENYFMYVEDMDICLKAKKMGYGTVFIPDTGIIHHGQKSSDRSFAVVSIYKGIVMFHRKHGSIFSLFLVKSILRLKAIYYWLLWA